MSSNGGGSASNGERGGWEEKKRGERSMDEKGKEGGRGRGLATDTKAGVGQRSIERKPIQNIVTASLAGQLD
ncbi:hypothetical protein V6N13_077860 [Hibiscus sabdariffa]|uniref:Uncharacterized protein n=1 Tax=Hibiscus sabdariffa TaxID=183260 RepID=A0ABR2RLY5_9ROSI